MCKKYKNKWFINNDYLSHWYLEKMHRNALKTWSGWLIWVNGRINDSFPQIPSWLAWIVNGIDDVEFIWLWVWLWWLLFGSSVGIILNK